MFIVVCENDNNINTIKLIRQNVGMVDKSDLKSDVLLERVGSSPTSGTNYTNNMFN